MPAQRLSKDNWIQTGLAALAEGGANTLNAEALARRLGTTKGSFYWHFDDVPAFHKAVLDSWKRGAFSAIVAVMQAEGAAPERLKRFGKLVTDDSAGTALRAWGHANPDAQETVAQVDTERLTYLSALMSGLGVTNPDYPRSAYATLVGAQGITAIGSKQANAAYATLIDLILALR